MENWKEIKDFPSYEISDKGSVRRKDTGYVRKLQLVKGYYMILLPHKSGKNKMKTVHRLVAEAFVPNPNNYPEVNHLDLDKLNNDAANLEWCTREQNLAHARSLIPAMSKEALSLANRGVGHPQAKLTEEKVKQIFDLDGKLGHKKTGDLLGVHENTVQKIRSGVGWNHMQHLNPRKAKVVS